MTRLTAFGPLPFLSGSTSNEMRCPSVRSFPPAPLDFSKPAAPAVVRLDEAVAPFPIEELDRPSHGHRVSSPAMLRRDRVSAPRPDRTFTAGKLGHLNGPALGRRSAWISLRPSSLRRNHSRKRNVKPVPTGRG